jgi:hypothetical protein
MNVLLRDKAGSLVPNRRQKEAGMLPAKYGSLSDKYSQSTVVTCDCIYTRNPASRALM